MKAAAHTGRPRFTGFMNDRQRVLALAQLRRLSWNGYAFGGGYEGAERAMLCVFEDMGPGEKPCFPIAAAALSLRETQAAPTHRDYLGAILGLGITRECVGDILPHAQGALVYLQQGKLPFLQQELTQVGRWAVAVAPAAEALAPAPAQEAQEGRASVASLRLDAVLAAMLPCSRSAAAALVQAGRVQVNHLLVEETHYPVCEGDVFSIRGTGKFSLCAVGGTSRKGRVIIEFLKY